jgi:hypothetical protein
MHNWTCCYVSVKSQGDISINGKTSLFMTCHVTCQFYLIHQPYAGFVKPHLLGKWDLNYVKLLEWKLISKDLSSHQMLCKLASQLGVHPSIQKGLQYLGIMTE